MPDPALTITVREETSRRGLFEVRIPALGRGAYLRRSRTPLLDAARALLAAGHAPDQMLEMWHEGAAAFALRGQIGALAKLTVAEDARNGPRFRPYRPFSTVAIPGRSRPGSPEADREHPDIGPDENAPSAPR